ncbi:MAG TPA: phosphotransferase [Thermoanaerobaculia bacterium]|jgi:aminoglycoside/choline kinase family phosphotransferase|nr:phosphotransferase [Thermoanaerobaculia bacterium]
MNFSDLAPWLAARGFTPERIEPLPGDVSPRRYGRVRLAGGAGAILAYYPEEIREVASRFLRTTELLQSVQVPVPRVLTVDLARGWMLIEDLGEQTLAERRDLDDDAIEPYFRHAAKLGRRIARLPLSALLDDVTNQPWNPPLDGPLLRRELRQTWDAFLLPRGLLGYGEQSRAIEALFDEICARLGAEAAVPCHRDFMARNLIPRSSEEVAVIDHQDLRLGPPRYDLASLLNDTRFPSPRLEAELLAETLGGEAEIESYHRAAAQRTLKAAGTYAKFAERGAPRHLPLIPTTLARALGHLARIPEGAEIAPDLTRLWGPALEAPAH